MKITEFRIRMPMTSLEYEIAQRFTVAEISKEETGGGEGVQVIIDEKISGMIDGVHREGQYTKKNYFLASKLPPFISKILKPENLVVEEESWNTFPFSRTVFRNPQYMKEHFLMQVDSTYLDDDGSTPNALNLTPKQLKIREVRYIDIARDKRHSKLFHRFDDDPSIFQSKKTGRGPLLSGWQSDKSLPVMTCYKVILTHFHWFGLQNFVESWLASSQEEYLLVFHKRVFCSIDTWYGMTKDDLLKHEAQTRQELENLRIHCRKQGVGASKISHKPLSITKPSSKKSLENVLCKKVSGEKDSLQQAELVQRVEEPLEISIMSNQLLDQEYSPIFEEEINMNADGIRKMKLTLKGLNFSYTISYPL